ncbi:MAG TPA: DUF2203 domain-containing protein [Acidobacteriota bacterium]|nr:DUF2203 domain-containing protein [Acidobacteriota bacterium]
MSDKYFSLEEARSLLPRIRESMGQAIEASHLMRGFSEEIKVLGENAVNNAGSPAGTAYLQHLLELTSHVSAIQDTGCLVKSVEDGLVDFPHLMDGREVYLCWRYGEDDIEYWHEVEAGFAGRQPISDS